MDLWSFSERVKASGYDNSPSLSHTTNEFSFYDQIIQEKKEVDMKFETIRNKLDDLKYDAIRSIETQNMARKFLSNCNELKDQRHQLRELSKNSIRIALELYKFTEKDSNVQRKFSEKIEFLQLTLLKLENNEIPETTSPIRDIFYTKMDLNKEGLKRTASAASTKEKIPRLEEVNGLSLNSSEIQAIDKQLVSNASVPPNVPISIEHSALNNISVDETLYTKSPPPNPTITRTLSSPIIYSTQNNTSQQQNDSPSEGFQSKLPKILPKPSSSGLSSPGGIGLKFLYSLPHGDVVSSIATAGTNGETIFTGGLGAVKLWDSNQAPEFPLLTLKSMENYIRTLGISPNGKILVVGGESDKIVLWDISESPPFSLTCFSAHSEAIYAVAFSKDSNFMFSCCSNGSIIVWDLINTKSLKIISGHSAGVTCVDVTPDGAYMITGSLDKTVRVWDLTTYQQVSCCVLNSPVFSLGLGYIGQVFEKSTAIVIAGLENSNISTLSFNDMIHATTQATANHEINSGHVGCITSIKFSSTRDRFLSTDKGGLVLGWRLALDGQSIYRLFAHRENTSILSSAISKDGTKFLTGSGEKLANVYRLTW